MDTNSLKNALSELEAIKNKAKSVQQELDFSKQSSLNLSESMAQKEVQISEKYSEQAASVKIEAIKKVDSNSQKISKRFLDDWMKAFSQAGNSAKDFGDTTESVLGKLAGQILPNVFGKGSTGGMLLDILDPVLKNVFGGFFAEGGRPSTGKVSIVGERGPELFVPDSAGTVVPNEDLQKGSGVVVYQNFTFQSLDPATNMKLLQAQKDQIQSWVADGIKNNQNGLRSSVKSV
ncbi:MAG: hypothetical protein WCF95_04200 [bacterium]